MNSTPDKGTVTWVNHYSIIQCLDSGVPLSEFDAIGIDGVFLRIISGLGLKHSSADYSLPSLIEHRKLTVALIGGDAESAESHQASFQLAFPLATILWSIPGDAASLEKVKVELTKDNFEVPEMLLIGMGAPLQEFAALELRKILNLHGKGQHTLIATCGGWLDQLGVVEYYPRWATPMRLNWLVRLWREPGRLWKRYFLYPIEALAKRKKILDYLSSGQEFIG
jgi:exopolysaccharide biosynthesis WecB/TagA/CpsF family protein